MKSRKIWFGTLLSVSLGGILFWLFFIQSSSQKNLPDRKFVIQPDQGDSVQFQNPDSLKSPKVITQDSVEFFKRVRSLAHDSIPKTWQVFSIYPGKDALLPYHRIVAMYGNFYSKSMGILGRVSEEELLKQFQIEVAKWNEADSLTPALPAIHYIAITAQKDPGPENFHRLRMPKAQLEKAILLGRSLGGITFLDVQVGHSTVEQEVPTLEKFLLEKDVHLGIDPEWSMKDGSIPGSKIGTLDAKDINFAIEYLSELVLKNGLPPKILVVHRFSNDMITNHKEIKATPQVQVVINMDGFGFPAKKVTSYRKYVGGMPVQFTGIKLFYLNDTIESPHRLMTPKEILSLYPKPIYIQYQ
ncbi:hypothetical protein [Algoriphagus sanaruensis]|uniref:hypothetical protein n=1 Tax=Algoriphagus sanaruensis TaxID=1727163 RepID=UPI0011DF916F|nr:hypothetical protein [Algoriphagus sanaruensis]